MKVPEFLDLFLVKKSHAVHIDIEGTFDPSAARFFHSFPVVEGLGDQGIGGNGGDGFVPVLHLHGIQADIDHIAVGIVFGHGDPVAHIHHFIGRELDTGHKSQDGILKNQQQYCGHGPQSSKQARIVIFTKEGDDKDHGHGVEDDFYHLNEAFNVPSLGDRQFLIDFMQGI